MRLLTSLPPAVRAGVARREVLGLAAAGLFWRSSPAMALPASLQFKVFRKGDEIGMHRVTFTPTAAGFDVDVDVELAVKMAFITVFRYRQTARDSWKGGNLVSADYKTDDDGKRTELLVREQSGRLKVDGPAGSAEAPLGTMTDLAFWNESIVDAPRLVDSQTGQIGTMRTQSRNRERITVKGREVDATRYTVSGSENRGGKVWYVDREWVKASFVTRGEALDYVLA
jgi:hypothetical protein